MYSLMNLQATCVNECFIAHITGIWTLPSMSMTMYLQMFTLLECSITHITGICMFHSIYPLALFHSTLLSKCFSQGSLLKKKKGSNITNLKIQNILKLSFTSDTQELCHKKCVILSQISLNIAPVIYVNAKKYRRYKIAFLKFLLIRIHSH